VALSGKSRIEDYVKILGFACITGHGDTNTVEASYFPALTLFSFPGSSHRNRSAFGNCSCEIFREILYNSTWVFYSLL
jgi:hypothetical protein